MLLGRAVAVDVHGPRRCGAEASRLPSSVAHAASPTAVQLTATGDRVGPDRRPGARIAGDWRSGALTVVRSPPPHPGGDHQAGPSPAPGARTALERADDLVGDPAAVEPARLRRTSSPSRVIASNGPGRRRRVGAAPGSGGPARGTTSRRRAAAPRPAPRRRRSGPRPSTRRTSCRSRRPQVLPEGGARQVVGRRVAGLQHADRSVVSATTTPAWRSTRAGGRARHGAAAGSPTPTPGRDRATRRRPVYVPPERARDAPRFDRTDQGRRSARARRQAGPRAAAARPAA